MDVYLLFQHDSSTYLILSLFDFIPYQSMFSCVMVQCYFKKNKHLQLGKTYVNFLHVSSLQQDSLEKRCGSREELKTPLPARTSRTLDLPPPSEASQEEEEEEEEEGVKVETLMTRLNRESNRSDESWSNSSLEICFVYEFVV